MLGIRLRQRIVDRTLRVHPHVRDEIRDRRGVSVQETNGCEDCAWSAEAADRSGLGPLRDRASGGNHCKYQHAYRGSISSRTEGLALSTATTSLLDHGPEILVSHP